MVKQKIFLSFVEVLKKHELFSRLKMKIIQQIDKYHSSNSFKPYEKPLIYFQANEVNP